MPGVVLRGGYNYLKYEADDTFDDIAYQGDLDLEHARRVVRRLPPVRECVLHHGLPTIGEKSLDLTATPTANVQIGNQTFTPAQVGALGLTRRP